MFYIAICDDNKIICSEIESILINYCKKSTMKLTIDVFYNGESLLKYMEDGHVFDLIFLDIEMEGVDGLQVGYQIRKVQKNYRTEIVFVSGKEGYDRQLFEFQPLHFISKPINEQTVIEDLQLAMLRSEHLQKHFEYNKKSQHYRIPINEILYFVSFNREVIMITDQDNEIFYSTLDNIESQLSAFQFYRIHRSYLVNCNRIRIIRYSEVVMSNGEILPISKSNRKDFRNFQIQEERGFI